MKTFEFYQKKNNNPNGWFPSGCMCSKVTDVKDWTVGYSNKYLKKL